MILQSLVKLARREELLGDLGYQTMAVPWLIHLGERGNIVSVSSTGELVGKSKKEVASSLPVPQRRSRGGKAIVPHRLVDKALYILGLGDPAKVEAEDAYDRLSDCFGKMIEETEQLAEVTADVGVAAQCKAMRAIRDQPEVLTELWCDGEETVAVPHASGKIVNVPKRWGKNLSSLVAFTFKDEVTGEPILVCRRPAVRQHFAAAAQPHAPVEGKGEICLVSGIWCTPVDTHPQFDLPGDTGPLPLISFNQRSFEHYGRKGNENAPIGEESATAYVTALRRLLGRGDFKHPTTGAALPRRNLSITKSTTVLYWSDAPVRDADPADDLFLDAVLSGQDADKIKQVEAIYAAPRTGRPPLVEDSTAFHTLVLTREKARVVLRSAELHTVGSVAQSVQTFLQNLSICSQFENEREYRGLRNLIDGTVSANATDPEPSPDLAARMCACALDKRLPFPLELIAILVGRIRAHDKEGASIRRMALLRAVLNRSMPTSIRTELPMSLQADHPSRPYHLGRLFAVLEKAQQEATDAKAGIADRYLGTAMAAPALVFPRLLKLSRHHLSKIGGESPGREVNLEKLIDGIIACLPPEFPMTTALVDQGTFMIGYHHQRADLWKKKTESVASDARASA